MKEGAIYLYSLRKIQSSPERLTNSDARPVRIIFPVLSCKDYISRHAHLIPLMHDLFT